MSGRDPSPLRWHNASAIAPFAFYEPSNGRERWAGGFASDGSHIEVIALVDGAEVSVDTSGAVGATPEVARRGVIADLLWPHAIEGTGSDLPYSITIEADDRSVTLNGDIHPIHGIRINGTSRWVGTIRLDDVTVKVTTTSSSALALRVCTDASSLSEFPHGSH